MCKPRKHERAIRELFSVHCVAAGVSYNFEEASKSSHVKVCLTKGAIRHKMVYTRNAKCSAENELQHIDRDIKKVLKGIFKC